MCKNFFSNGDSIEAPILEKFEVQVENDEGYAKGQYAINIKLIVSEQNCQQRVNEH